MSQLDKPTPTAGTESAAHVCVSRRELLTTSLLGAASLALTGCGGGGASAGNGSGVALSATQRNVVLTSIGAKYESLPHQSMDADNALIFTYLSTLPQLHSVQLTTSGTIAARFTDGPGYAFINNLDESRDTGRSTVMPSTATRATDQLPESGMAFLMNGLTVIPGVGALGNQFVNSVRNEAHLSQVDQMFQLRGYQRTTTFASLAALRQVNDAGLLYFIGHGGAGLDANGKLIYIILATDAVDPSHMDSQLASDIKLDYVGFSTYAGDTYQGPRRTKAAYYITPKFVKNYMSFSKYSLVFINGCAGIAPATPNPGIPAPNFAEAFFSAQTSAYMGWDDQVNSSDVRDSASFFFDRLLGSGLSNAPGAQQSPPVRPFDYNSVLLEMKTIKQTNQSFNLAQSLDSEPPKGLQVRRIANLVLAPSLKDQDTFGFLAPSIATLGVDDTNGLLTIFGSFGATTGTVTMAGQALTLAQPWGANQVTCKLPPTGGGDVIVTVNGRTSNPRRLSEWLLPIHYKGVGTGGDGHTETADFVLCLRADANSYRPNEGLAPQTVNLGYVQFVTAAASTCKYAYSGQYSGRDQNNTLNVINWAGAGSLTPQIISGTHQPPGFYYNGHFDFNAGKIYLTITAFTATGVVSTQPEDPNDKPLQLGWVGSSNYLGVTAVAIPINAQYTIPASSLPGSFPADSFSSLPNMNITFSWDTTSPTNGTAPDPNQARSAAHKSISNVSRGRR